MYLKTYHICSKKVWMEAVQKGLFHPQIHSHNIELDGGDILTACTFSDVMSEEIWYTTPGVTHLPHPMFEGGRQLDKAHFDRLKGTLPDLKPTHTVVDLARQAGAIHPLMKLSSMLS